MTTEDLLDLKFTVKQKEFLIGVIERLMLTKDEDYYANWVFLNIQEHKDKNVQKGNMMDVMLCGTPDSMFGSDEKQEKFSELMKDATNWYMNKVHNPRKPANDFKEPEVFN